MQTAFLQALQHKASKTQTVYSPATTTCWPVSAGGHFRCQGGQDTNFYRYDVLKKQLIEEYHCYDPEGRMTRRNSLGYILKATIKARTLYQKLQDTYYQETDTPPPSTKYTLQDLQQKLAAIQWEKASYLEEYSRHYRVHSLGPKNSLPHIKSMLKIARKRKKNLLNQYYAEAGKHLLLGHTIENARSALEHVINQKAALMGIYRLYFKSLVLDPKIPLPRMKRIIKDLDSNYAELCDTYCERYQCYPGAYDTVEAIRQELNEPDTDYRKYLLDEHRTLLSERGQPISSMLLMVVHAKTKNKSQTYRIVQPKKLSEVLTPAAPARERYPEKYTRLRVITK